MARLRILKEGKAFIAVHKPSGLASYADSAALPPGARELLEKQLRVRRLFPVHRIDKDTCGVLVFARDEGSARMLTDLFRTRLVRKSYLAIVHGLVEPRAEIALPLPKNKEKTPEPALTLYERIAACEPEWDGERRAYSLVRCELKTGRFHQIRRHFRAVGHPLCGDPEYGNGWDNRAFRERFGVERTLLCALTLSFPDRARQEMVRIATRPDADFQRAQAIFGPQPALDRPRG